MRFAKSEMATAAVLTAGVLSVVAAMPVLPVMGETAPATTTVVQQTSTGDNAAWVEKRVREWQPTPDERGFDKIGWARDIREAQRLSKQSGRPVFLFTLDGRMGIGRC